MGFWRQLIRGRLFGHPIHAMLVHFPSAIFPLALILDLIAAFGGAHEFYHCSFYSLCFGLLGGYAAACFGLIDFVKLPSNHPAWNKAFLHACLNITWLILFTVVAGVKYKTFPEIAPTSLALLITEGVGTIGMLFSNYLGGELVFTHKIGMK